MLNLDIVGELKMDERVVEFGTFLVYFRKPGLLNPQYDDGVLVNVFRVKNRIHKVSQHHD